MSRLHIMNKRSPNFVEELTKMTTFMELLASERKEKLPTLMERSPEVATALVNVIVKHIFRLVGDTDSWQWLQGINLMTLNTITQSLCFSYHPSQVGKRAFHLE